MLYGVIFIRLGVNIVKVDFKFESNIYFISNSFTILCFNGEILLLVKGAIEVESGNEKLTYSFFNIFLCGFDYGLSFSSGVSWDFRRNFKGIDAIFHRLIFNNERKEIAYERNSWII